MMKVWKKSSKKRKGGILMLVAYFLYFNFGYFALPRVVRAIIEENVGGELGRKITVESVRFNPFLLSLELNNIIVEDDHAEELAAVGFVRINAQLISIFIGEIVLEEFVLADTRFSLSVDEGGTSNIERLLALLESSENASASEESIALSVRATTISLQNLVANFEDRSYAKPFVETVGPINLKMSDFETAPQSISPYSFEAQIGEGTRIDWKGEFGLFPLASKGELRLEGLKIGKGESFWYDIADVQASGTLSAVMPYDAALKESGIEFRWTNALFELADLQLKSESAEELSFVIPNASFRSDLDFSSRHIEILEMKTKGVGAVATIAKDGVFSLPRINWKEGADSEVENVQVRPDWTIAGGNGSFEGTRLTLVDKSLSQTQVTRIENLDVAIESIAWGSPESMTEIGYSGVLASGGAFEGGASIDLNAIDGTANIEFEGIDITGFNRYVAEFVNASLKGGKVGGNFNLEISDGENVKAIGDVTVDGLDVALIGAELSVFGAKLLELQGLNYDLAAGLRVDKVILDKPSGKAILDEEGNLNLLKIAKVEEVMVSVQDESELVSESVMPVNVDEISISSGEFQISDLSLQPAFLSSVGNFEASIRNVSTDPEQVASFDVSMSIDGTSTLLGNGSLFPLAVDRKTEFEISIRTYDMTAVSTYFGKYLGRSLSKGHFALVANIDVVDEKLVGSNDLLLDQLTLGERIDSPDSLGLPIGFAIDVLKDRQGVIELKEVKIEGDFSDPSLNKGSIVFQAISRVFRNIIVKTATSPFAVLSGLVGGKENMDTFTFLPGEYLLDESMKSQLDDIATILEERPGLKVDLSAIAADAPERLNFERIILDQVLQNWDVDQTQLATLDPFQLLENFDQSLFEGRLKESYRRQIESKSLDLATVPVDSSDSKIVAEVDPTVEGKKMMNPIALFSTIVSKVRGKEKENSTANENLESVEVLGENVAPENHEKVARLIDEVGVVFDFPTVEEMLKSLKAKRSNLEVSDDWLKGLSRRRALEAKRYLVDTRGISADRIFFSEEKGTVSDQTDQSVVKFGLTGS